jgi:hypothetical protein
MNEISRDLLETTAAEFFGGELEAMPLERLRLLITASQYCTDLLLNEIERRGELTIHDGLVIVPYHCDHVVPTVLNR